MAFTPLFQAALGQTPLSSFMDRFIDQLPSATGFVDVAGQLLGANQAWLKLFMVDNLAQANALFGQTQACDCTAKRVIRKALASLGDDSAPVSLSLHISACRYQFELSFAQLSPELFTVSAVLIPENIYKKIYDVMPIPYGTWSSRIELLDINTAMHELVGMADKEEYMNRVLEFFPETQVCGTPTALKMMQLQSTLLETGHAQSVWTHKHKDGSLIEGRLDILRVDLDNGDYVGATFLQSANNLLETAQKIEYEQKRTLEAENMNQLLLSAAPIAIDIWDKHGVPIYCNEHTLKMFSLESQADYLTGFTALYPTLQPSGRKSTDVLQEKFDIAMSTGFCVFDFLHLNALGQEIPLEISLVRLLKNGEYSIAGYMFDLRPVYASIEKEREFEQEKQRIYQDLLESEIESNKSKSTFLAHMSHEIRTPISAVLGISQIQLQNAELAPKVQDAFSRIHRSANTLHKIANDILDLSKVEAGKLRLLIEEYTVDILLRDLINLQQGYLDYSNTRFQVDIDPNLPWALKGDILRIEQILSNLLSNAFKYTPEGTISLSVKAQPWTDEDDSADIELQVVITDTGVGMSPEQVESIYDAFTRFHEKEHRHVSGVGLGMPIVYNLCSLMDARIEISSEVGRGTRIEVGIPQKSIGQEVIGRELAEELSQLHLTQSTTTNTPKAKTKSLNGHKVLVVDDVETNLYVAEGLLSFYELQVETAQSGEEALQKIKDGHVYDLIFMDHMMPGLDGVETLHAIRQVGYTKPIVVLTANAMIGQAEKFIRAGFDGFISKPIQTHHLNSILFKFVHSGPVTPLTDTNRFMNNPQVMQQLQLDFVKHHIETIEQIRQHIDNKDLATAHRLAHNLKTAAGLIGQQALSELAAQLEKQLGEKLIPMPQLLERAGTAVRTIVTDIVAQRQPSATVPSKEKLTKSSAQALFEAMLPLLETNNVSVIKHRHALEKLAGAETLLHHIDEFQFEQALQELLKLQAQLG